MRALLSHGVLADAQRAGEELPAGEPIGRHSRDL
jgi:hypothetical protein